MAHRVFWDLDSSWLHVEDNTRHRPGLQTGGARDVHRFWSVLLDKLYDALVVDDLSILCRGPDLIKTSHRDNTYVAFMKLICFDSLLA